MKSRANERRRRRRRAKPFVDFFPLLNINIDVYDQDYIQRKCQQGRIDHFSRFTRINNHRLTIEILVVPPNDSELRCFDDRISRPARINIVMFVFFFRLN